MRLYEKAVRTGKCALGDLFFKENGNHFWGLIETGPYMHTLEGLIRCLWNTGKRQEVIEILQEMLRLNPNDNQGVRYTLAAGYWRKIGMMSAASFLRIMKTISAFFNLQ